MSRRHRAEKREILPDARFGNLLIAKLTNQIMLDGKKSAAEQIVYGACEIIRQKMKLSGDDAVVDFVRDAISKVRPQLEVRSRRVGGATYQVPMEVRPERAQTLAIRWLVGKARQRGERTMVERLANELMDAMNETGGAVKKRDETHKMAEANRAFAHYRW